MRSAKYIAAAKGFDQAHDPEGASKAYRYIVDIKPKALLKPQQREARIEHPEGARSSDRSFRIFNVSRERRPYEK